MPAKRARLKRSVRQLEIAAATVAEKELFTDGLTVIGQNNQLLPAAEISGFLAMTGDLYTGDLMVVGRAVNGWLRGILPAELASSRVANSYAEEVFQSVTADGTCPMQWVTDCWGDEAGDYNTARSAFWRVIRKTVGVLGIADPEDIKWPSHLVWSNLYKVAPADGGNPGNALAEIQFDNCLALFNLELKTYAPRKVLFLTGWDWAGEFLKNCPNIEMHAGLLEASGTISVCAGDSCRFAVAKHPQGKPEALWVDAVSEALRD